MVPSIALTMAALVVLVAVLAMHSARPAYAAEPPPPSANCWGGALSEDPLHCYAFAEAQRQGIIEVEGVYEAGTVLYIVFDYLPEISESEDAYPLWEEFIQLLKDIMLASNAWPDRVPSTSQVHGCRHEAATQADKECLVEATFVNDDLIPWSGSYDRIKLRGGGASHHSWVSDSSVPASGWAEGGRG